MSQPITRRDFLKLVSLLPFLTTGWPSSLQSANRLLQGKPSPNILILVFDALSAHNVSLYGYRRETTPNLARFAEKATVYHNHQAGGSFTSAGTASLLTGTYPWTHRAIHLHGTIDESRVSNNIFNQFAAQGYTTLGYSHNLLVTSLFYQFREDLDIFKKTRELCLVDDQFGDRLFPNDLNTAFWSEWLVLRGEDSYPGSLFLSFFHRLLRFARKREINKELGELFPKGVPALHNLFFILEDAVDWIKSQVNNLPQPYLAYFHFLPPHEPYTTRRDFVDIFKDGWKPEPKPARFFSDGRSDDFLNKNRREYDEYIAYADAEFGRLYDFMVQNGVLDNTCLIVTSDHGELFERGIRGHVTRTLYSPVTRVPLLISQPGQTRREDVYSPTSCVDILPTLLHLTGQNIPDWCEGSILPPFADSAESNQRSVYSVEAKSNPKQAPLSRATLSIIKDEFKLVRYLGYGAHANDFELFNLANDPDEVEDLLTVKKSIAGELQNELDKKLSEVNQPFLV